MKHARWLARRMLCKCDLRLHDGVTRAREKLAVIVVQAPALFEKVLSILQ